MICLMKSYLAFHSHLNIHYLGQNGTMSFISGSLALCTILGISYWIKAWGMNELKDLNVTETF